MRALVAGFVVLGGFALLGCSGSDGGASGSHGPIMRHVAAWSGDGQDAEIRGVIELEGDCLYVALDEVGERYPVIWPASTSWDAAASRVLLANGESVRVGEAVYGGGGYGHVDDVASMAGDTAAALAARCVDNRYGEIAVVNNQPDAIRLAG